jgi:hypothetical protein
MDTLNPILVSLVVSAATELCSTNSTVTTLEIKQLIRHKHPGLYITQSQVSDIMMLNEPLFDYKDLSTHRQYALSDSSSAALASYSKSSTKIVSKKKLAAAIMACPAVTEITWVKKNSETRTIKDFIPRGFTELGYIQGYTSEGTKSIDPRTLVSAVIDSTKYSCK